MASFFNQDLADLARQLQFAPPERRREQIDHAERLYWQIDPQRNYPLDFVIYRITQFRPDDLESTMLTGEVVQHDLLLLVEKLSGSLDERADTYNPPPLDLDAVCKKLNVSRKSISRYRRQGLFARRFVFGAGRKRLGFLPASVERFVASRPDGLAEAAQFSRIDEPSRHRIITRARRITSRVDASPFAIARHLSRKFNRSGEAIRQLLLEHDRADPRVAIFPDHTPPLSDKQQRIIHRAYHWGVPVMKMARRYGRARNAIYRAINRRRAAVLRQLQINWIHSPTFELPDAEQVILESALPQSASAENAGDVDKREASDANDSAAPYLPELYKAPLLDAAMERALFVRYNFLKYRAAQWRDKLDAYQPRSHDLDRIETYLRRSVAVKETLAKANLKLVVSVARRHLSGRSRADHQSITDLIGEGNLVLLQAIETFDAGRGNRFSTYLSWALMRRFAQAGQGRQPVSYVDPQAVMSEYWPAALNPNVAAVEQSETLAAALRRLLHRLDDRERFIITRHFGLTDESGQSVAAQTLAQVAEELGISAERARQIEHRALKKLREVVGDMDAVQPEP